MTYTERDRRTVSDAGQKILAAAVSIDHDWALPASSEDKLIDAVAGLSDADLEGAYLLAHHLREAIACVEIRRQMPGRPMTHTQTGDTTCPLTTSTEGTQ